MRSQGTIDNDAKQGEHHDDCKDWMQQQNHIPKFHTDPLWIGVILVKTSYGRPIAPSISVQSESWLKQNRDLPEFCLNSA
jgi:hypothetical protein